MPKHLHLGTFIYMLLLSSVPAHGGRYAAEFLHMGVGARSWALGGGFVALADDPTAGYWNPAGLGDLSAHGLVLTHVPLFEQDGMYDAGCLALQLPADAGISIMAVRLGVADIPHFRALEGTTVDRMTDPSLRSTGQPEGTFSDVGEGLFLSFGKMTTLVHPGMWSSNRLRVRIGYGVTFKTFRQVLFDFTGTGSGLDAGLLLSIQDETFAFREIRVGLVVRDTWNTRMTWNTRSQHGDVLPATASLAVAYVDGGEILRGRLAFTGGLQWSEDSKALPSVGGEYVFRTRLSLRGAFSDTHFSAGAGLRLSRFTVDYALSEQDLDLLHRISGEVRF